MAILIIQLGFCEYVWFNASTYLHQKSAFSFCERSEPLQQDFTVQFTISN